MVILILAVYGILVLVCMAILLAYWSLVGIGILLRRAYRAYRLRSRLRELETGTCDGWSAKDIARLIAEWQDTERR